MHIHMYFFFPIFLSLTQNFFLVYLLVFFLLSYCCSLLLQQSSNFGLRSIQVNELNNAVISANESESNTKEAWSELIVRIDNHMLNADNRKILIRCETNIFNLYRGTAEAELKISDDNVWMNGGKVSPTTDQRSSSSSSSGSTSSKTGDPDNSALQAGARQLFRHHLDTSYYLLYAIFLLVITTILS